MTVRDGSYITIQSWMVNDLKLKGNELLAYAVIFGFSQDGETYFDGSLRYLADWTNSTRQGVSKVLKSLVEKGLIEKKDTHRNGIKFCSYRATKLNGVYNKSERGVQQSLTGGVQQSLTNNIEEDNTRDNIKDIGDDGDTVLPNNTAKKKEKNPKSTIFQDFADGNQELLQALYDFEEYRKEIKKPMTDKAKALLIGELKNLSTDPKTQIEIINQSILKRWLGVFPLKQQNSNNTNHYNYGYGREGVDYL